MSTLFGSEAALIIIFIGISSALISTIDTNTSILCVVIAKLFDKKDNVNLTHLRIISVGIGVGAFLLAFIANDIVDLIVSAGAVVLVLFPSVVGILVAYPRVIPASWRVCSFASITSGAVTLVISYLVLDPKSAFVVGFLVSGLVWLLMLMFTKFKS